MNTADIERLARLRLGKPFVMGSRGPDAYDCSGLVAAVLSDGGVALGLPVEYSRFHDDGRKLARELFRVLAKVPGPPRPGDVLIFTPENGDLMGFHMGFLTSCSTVIHADASSMAHKVVETAFNDVFKARVTRVYRLKELL